jgi:hypothetical protein
MKADRLFLIYVAKEKEWQQMELEDWGYVSAMARFFRWWAQRYFGISLSVHADILPIVPGKLFDRTSIAYLIRDHSERGQERPAGNLSEIQRYSFYADNNCPRVSHVLAHELLRMKGKTKKDFFGKVHEIWDRHVYNVEPFLYFDNQFKRVSGVDSYRFVTLNPDEL